VSCCARLPRKEIDEEETYLTMHATIVVEKVTGEDLS
jgi:hypothetical protein